MPGDGRALQPGFAAASRGGAYPTRASAVAAGHDVEPLVAVDAGEGEAGHGVGLERPDGVGRPGARDVEDAALLVPLVQERHVAVADLLAAVVEQRSSLFEAPS